MFWMIKLILPAAASVLLIGCSQGGADDGSQNEAPSSSVDVGTQSVEPMEKMPSERSDPAEDVTTTAQNPSILTEIPERFHGKFAESRSQCDNLSHGLFTVGAKKIEFFESFGEVRTIKVDGDYAAASIFEQYGDSPGTTYVFYMRLMPDRSLRYRYDKNDPMTWVRCP